jgi:lysozyme
MDVKTMLEQEEGRRHQAYPDPLTGGDPWTIGIGHTGPDVHEGTVWTDQQIDAVFMADLEECMADCTSRFPWFSRLDQVRQAVVLGMRFQLGMRGLAGFPKMLAYIRDQRFPQAAGEMRNSLWARQTPSRANRMAAMMETGQW